MSALATSSAACFRASATRASGSEALSSAVASIPIALRATHRLHAGQVLPDPLFFVGDAAQDLDEVQRLVAQPAGPGEHPEPPEVVHLLHQGQQVRAVVPEPGSRAPRQGDQAAAAHVPPALAYGAREAPSDPFEALGSTGAAVVGGNVARRSDADELPEPFPRSTERRAAEFSTSRATSLTRPVSPH